MEQDNEKIIYDIEVRTKIDEAQQELRKLKQELKTNNREELLVNLKIVGTENFKSIKQNLSEIRKAIEILEKHNSTTLTLNGAGFDITLNKLRALEKELEDFQTKVNKGNLNNQIKEQQKLSEARAKQELNNQMLLAKAEENRQKAQVAQTEKNKQALNDYYINEEKRIRENSNRSKQAYQEWSKQETSKEKQAEKNKKNLDNYFTDEEKRIQENSNRSRQAYAKITDSINKYNNILDSVNKKKELGIQLSEKEYASVEKRLQNAKNNVVSSGGMVSELPILQDRASFNNEARKNYLSGVTSKSLLDLSYVTSYSEKMTKLRTILDNATYAWEQSGRTNASYRNTMIQARAEIDKTASSLRKLQEATGNVMSLSEKMKLGLRTHMTWIASSILASVPLVLPGYAVNTMKDLESRFATVEQVIPEIEHAHMNSLDKNLSEMERMEGLKTVNKEMNTFIDIGSKFGVAVEEVISAGASIGRMYGQGENGVTNTNLLTQQAARIAVADNFPIMQATKGLESALSQFELQTDDTNQLLVNSNRIIDTWTLAAHRGAASAQDLTEGVSLAGAAAHQAGVSFEFLNALIATGVRTTGRSGNEIGNSIKSFINSMQSDKSIEALKDFGINVYKDNGDGTQSLRSMEDIILDISRMMQTTEKETSKLLLTLSGGKYQVSKMTAILKDYNELVRMSGLLNSDEVIGFTDKQIDIQLNTLNRKMERLGTNIKGLFVDIGESGVLNDLKDITDEINNLVVGVKELDISWSNWIKTIVAGVVAYKGVPFLVDKLAQFKGRMAGLDIAYQTNNIQSRSFSDRINNRYSDMFLQGYYGVNADKDTDGIKSNTASVKENTSAKQANKVANQTNGITLATETASELKNTTQVNANTIAKDRNTVATSRMSTASKAASATLALFGGGFGLVLTAITLILPELLSYISELGEEKNAHKELIETLDEENAKREQEYNNKMRAIDTAEKLSEQYRKMTEDSKKMAEGSEEQIKIQKDLSNTYDIIKDVIEGLGDKNNKYTISTDENGKIIVKVNGNIIDSFDDLKSATTELTKQKLEADKAQLESSRHSTKTMLENIKARIEA